MTAYAAVLPLATAIYTLLNVSALTDLLVAPDGTSGGVHTVVPQTTSRPYVYFELSNPRQLGGFGTSPGHGDVPELELQVHAITDQPNVSQGQAIVAKAIELLFTTTLVVAGYVVCSNVPMPDIQILNLGDQVIANVVVHEEVAIVRLILQNTNA